MDYKQRTERVLALIKPYPEYDLFSKTNRNSNIGHGLDIGSPYNFQGFTTRISTYRPEDWAAIPNAAVCFARHGFVCVEGCRVQCWECKAEIEMKQNTSGKKEIASAAEKFHEKYCKWRYICTPQVFFRIPSIPGKLYHDLKSTWEDLIDLGPSLPVIHYSSLTASNSFPEFVKRMLESVGSVEGVVQTSALLLALCGWVKLSNSSIQCNFCQRKCAMWNFFSVEDDGWTLCPSRANVCDEIRSNISLEEGRHVDDEDSILCCEAPNVNKCTAPIETRSCMSCKTEKEDAQSVESSDSSESVNRGPSLLNYNELCLGSASAHSDREEESSIHSEESVKNVSSSDSCRTSKSLIVLNTRLRDRRCRVSIPAKNREPEKKCVEYTESDGWNNEHGEAEEGCVQKLPDDLEDNRCDESDVLDEENECDNNIDESIDSEYDERDDQTYYEGTEDEKTSAMEKGYWSEEASSENELCLENDDSNLYGRSISQSSINSVEYVDDVSICEESCIISCETGGINNTSDLVNVNGEPMYIEDEFTENPKIDHPESSKNLTVDYPFVLYHSNEQFSTDSVNETESSCDNFPKIVSTMTLQNPESNNFFFPKKDDCNESELELIIQPELCPSVDNIKLVYSSNGKLNVNFDDKNIETTSKSEENSFRDKGKVLTNLSSAPDYVSFVSDENDTNEIQIVTHNEYGEELKMNENIGEMNSEPETSGILYVVLNEENAFGNKNHQEISSEAESSNELEIVDMEEYEINNNTDIAINENKFSGNKIQPEVVPFENNVNQTELITNESKQEEPGFKCVSGATSCSIEASQNIIKEGPTSCSENIECVSGATSCSIEAPQNIIQAGPISCSENISINNEHRKSEYIFECHEKTEPIEQRCLQLPLHSVANDFTGKEILLELDDKTSEFTDSSLSQANSSSSSIIQVIQTECTSDAVIYSLSNELNGLDNEQSDVNFINNQIGDKCNLEGHCLENMEIIQSIPSVLDYFVNESCPQEDSKNKNEEQDNLKSNDVIVRSEKYVPISDKFKGDKSESINANPCTANISIRFPQPEESIDTDPSSSIHVSTISKYEVCSENNCDHGKVSSGKLEQSLDDDCSITFTNKKKDTEDNNPVNCEEIIIQEYRQPDDTIEMSISEEDSRLKEVNRNCKRKYEEVQETDEIDEHPPKIIKLEVSKTLFHPVFEHRFWCIWRTNQLSSDYQKKRGWEFALECIQEYLKNYKISDKIDKFEQYLQCLETLYKY